ncbi:hypothetical protein VNI00_012684 [Paramarasmius palmivorus]|uniref:F-box domain-containing protein n=1 Tax=Paramarasmius palmivorus TaxID=297713 RepID=A0AAW0C4V0_9AGAR
MNALNNLPYPAQTTLFDVVPTKDLLALRVVSKETLLDLNQYTSTTFALPNIYGHFFTPNQQPVIRTKLAHAGGLISGPAVFDMFRRQSAEPQRIDIYAPENTIPAIGQAIKEMDYTYQPLPSKVKNRWNYDKQLPVFEDAVRCEFSKWCPNTGDIDSFCDDSTVAGVFTFANKKEKEIRLIATRTEPVEVILSFHSTHLMNFATATEYVSLYPKSTFLDKRALVLETPTTAMQGIYDQCGKEGWTTTNSLTAEEVLRRDDELSLQTRWVGDSHCWIIKLAQLKDFNQEEAQYHALWVASWHLSCPGANRIQISFHRLEDKRLANPYILTWEAEKAVWAHPCFRALEDAIVTGGIADNDHQMEGSNGDSDSDHDR